MFIYVLIGCISVKGRNRRRFRKRVRQVRLLHNVLLYRLLRSRGRHIEGCTNTSSSMNGESCNNEWQGRTPLWRHQHDLTERLLWGARQHRGQSALNIETDRAHQEFQGIPDGLRNMFPFPGTPLLPPCRVLLLGSSIAVLPLAPCQRTDRRGRTR